MAEVFDAGRCLLGEGSLWLPDRDELLWVDIDAGRLHAKGTGARRDWQFDGAVSAAGRVGGDRVLVAGERSLMLFDLEAGTHDELCALEADNPLTRSNDGRADPFGGYWISTMGKKCEAGAGAIYRYYRGELRQLYAPLSIPNAICFTPDGGFAHFTDTPTRKIWRVRLGRDGWPAGEPELFLDLPVAHYQPDGAVVDRRGNLWCAHYGHAKVTCHSPDARELASLAVPARSPTCPAFGPPGLLYVTSAGHGTAVSAGPAAPDGQTFVMEVDAEGQPGPEVVL